jgi:TPP-dependent pyruvate/acetoin dehydrogenase alpha subunit
MTAWLNNGEKSVAAAMASISRTQNQWHQTAWRNNRHHRGNGVAKSKMYGEWLHQRNGSGMAAWHRQQMGEISSGNNKRKISISAGVAWRRKSGKA